MRLTDRRGTHRRQHRPLCLGSCRETAASRPEVRLELGRGPADRGGALDLTSQHLPGQRRLRPPQPGAAPHPLEDGISDPPREAGHLVEQEELLLDAEGGRGHARHRRQARSRWCDDIRSGGNATATSCSPRAARRPPTEPRGPAGLRRHGPFSFGRALPVSDTYSPGHRTSIAPGVVAVDPDRSAQTDSAAPATDGCQPAGRGRSGAQPYLARLGRLGRWAGAASWWFAGDPRLDGDGNRLHQPARGLGMTGTSTTLKAVTVVVMSGG